MIDVLCDLLCQTCCRILHGHLMVNLGPTQRGVTLWMCARCARCEALDKLTDDSSQTVVVQHVAAGEPFARAESMRRLLERAREQNLVP